MPKDRKRAATTQELCQTDMPRKITSLEEVWICSNAARSVCRRMQGLQIITASDAALEEQGSIGRKTASAWLREVHRERKKRRNCRDLSGRRQTARRQRAKEARAQLQGVARRERQRCDGVQKREGASEAAHDVTRDE